MAHVEMQRSIGAIEPPHLEEGEVIVKEEIEPEKKEIKFEKVK